MNQRAQMFVTCILALTGLVCLGSAAATGAEDGDPGLLRDGSSATADAAAQLTCEMLSASDGRTVAELWPLVGAPSPELRDPDGREFERTDVDPGVPVEGDYLGWAAFTPDGARVLLTNRMTDDVTVFDAATREVLANVAVGRYPAGVATTDDYAIVTCAFADEVHIIDLSDYSTAAVLPTGEQPWVVRIAADQQRAYVSCDIDDVCEVIDLTTLTTVQTIPDFPIWLAMWGFNSENGRNFVEFSKFVLTLDGGQIIVPDGVDSIHFFNTATGAIDYSVSGVSQCMSVALAGDGSTVVAVTFDNPIRVHQIDVASHTLSSTVAIPEHTLGMALDSGVNADGSKAFVSISGNMSAMVRFDTQDYVTFTQTYSPFWIGTSPDHALAISGQYRFTILDFDEESILGQHQGNTQYYGAVSLVDFAAVGFDPSRHEGIYFYEFPYPHAPIYRGTTDSGEPPEGDAPRRVALTPDGRTAVVANVLSDNVTIIDLDTYAIEALLPIGDRVQNLAITSDGLWAVVCGMASNSVKILDLTSNTVAANVPTGANAGVVALSPDDAYAYVGNISSNTVSIVALEGPASHEVAELPCGTIGVVWAAYGVSSGIGVSPTGEYVLVAASFDDQVKVLDTATQTIVASLPTGDFPLQLAFNNTGEYAIVTNYLADTFTLMRIDGASSSVVGTYSSHGDGPLRLAYDPSTDQIGIGNYTSKTITRFVPETGAYLGTDYYTTYGSLAQIRYDALGEGAVVLTQSVGSTPGHLHRGGEVIALPAVPAYCDYVGPEAILPYGRGAAVAAVVMPGPDWLTVIEWDAAGVARPVTIPLQPAAALQAPRPNPVRAATQLRFTLSRPGRIELALLDLSGRRIESLAEGLFAAGEHRVRWCPSGLPRGVYWTELRLDGRPHGGQPLLVIGAE